MRNKLSLTICIPAYNEEENILHLLKDLSKQRQSNFLLEKIIVYSDGSSDGTVSLVKLYNNAKVTVIEGSERKGIAHGLNTMFATATSDAVVVLNADILIRDVYFLAKLVEPLVVKSADITSSEIKEIRSRSFFEEVIQVSMHCKRIIFEKYKKGNNLYTCHGLARAFSKKLYTKIHFTNSIGEDAYSYLFSVYNKFVYIFAKDAIAYYRVPDNFSDHEKQSIRFLQSKNKFIKLFGEDFVKKEYDLPFYLCALALVITMKNYPIHTPLYMAVYIGIKIESLFKKQLKETWTISKSSKSLRFAKI